MDKRIEKNPEFDANKLKLCLEYLSSAMDYEKGFSERSREDAEKLDALRRERHRKLLEAFGLGYDSFRSVATVSNWSGNFLEACDGSLEEAAKYLYLKCSDLSMGNRWGVEFKTVRMFNLDKTIAWYKRYAKKTISFCENRLNKIMSERDSLGILDFFVREHDINGAKSAISRSISMMEQCLGRDPEFYTKVAVERYVDDPKKDILRNLEKIRSETLLNEIRLEGLKEKLVSGTPCDSRKAEEEN